MSGSSYSSSKHVLRQQKKKQKQSSFADSEVSKNETKQDVYPILVSYTPRPQANSKQAKHFQPSRDLPVLEQAIILLQKNAVEDPTEEQLSRKIDEVCEVIVSDEVRAAVMAAKEEKEKAHARVVAELDLKLSELKDKLNSPSMNVANHMAG